MQHPPFWKQPLMRLRATKHRREKPFAIMARSLDAAESFAEVDSKEQELLTSSRTPNRVAQQKPKLQSFTVGCATPAQRRRHVALHWLALHALRPSSRHSICDDQRQPAKPTHRKRQRGSPQNPRRNSGLFPVSQPQNRSPMRRLRHASPRQPSSVLQAKPRLRSSANQAQTES